MNIKTEIEKVLTLPIIAGGTPAVDYQCNAAFALAKQQNKKPFEIATQIADKFNKKTNLAVASAHQSGFINFTVSDTALTEMADFVYKTGKLPLQQQKSRTVFFDYGSANIAKQLHIGNLRSPIIGESLKRVFKAFGHKTVTDSFFGDWGLPMGLVLAQLESDGINEITYETLCAAYPKSSSRSKADENFMSRAQEITASLQQKQSPWYDKWKQIRNASIAKVMEIYDALGCTFDTLGGESVASDYVPAAIEILKKHGATESEGCLVFEVKNENDNAPMPPVILQKSNGGIMYATSDLAMMIHRQKIYCPNELVFVTDFRQELHFMQIFRTAKQSGILPQSTKCTHVSYGTINGSDGKAFKTRDGGTMPVNEIFELLTNKAFDKMKTKNREAAKKIGLAALKFADLSNGVRKDYIFDIDKFTSFEGKTGPYLLYTIARINSILTRKNTLLGGSKHTFKGVKHTNLTREIIIAVSKLTDSYTHAIENYTLNNLVDAAYYLASRFNLLYANESIQDNPANLQIAELTRTALIFALETLAITPVDEM